MTIEQDLHLIQVGGASLYRYPPLFSYDGKLLFCPCGSSVKVFSTNTAECVQKLDCKDKVTGVAQHPNNKLQVISSTMSGRLMLWDYEDGLLLKTVVVGSDITKLYCDPHIKSHAFAIVDGDASILRRIPLDASETNNYQDIASSVIWNISHPVGSLKCGQYLVFLKFQKICVVNATNATDYVHHKASRDGRISCLSCHPTEDCIATGHESGKIKIWHNLCPTSKKSNPSIISTSHWHSNRVRSLSFTPGGSSLLSVGTESVLVQWHYKDGSKQSFLPRLGNPCHHVVTSSDGTLYATTHSDNSLSIITNYFSVKHAIQGLTSVEKNYSNDLLFQYDPKTKACVTTGKPGHLVFYDLSSDCEVFSLDITHENLIAPDFKTRPRETKIVHVANQGGGSNECSWMATTEKSTMKEFPNESKLKFWVIDEADKWWKLNTVINDPHSISVTRICFRPKSPEWNESCMVSTGKDGMVKLWGVTEGTSYWSCVATASYKGSPALYCDFSQDGSVLAVAFNHSICLLDPVTLEISSVVLTSWNEEDVQRLIFGKHSCQQMLVVISKSCIQAYDLLDGMLSWVVNLHVCHVATDPLSDFMFILSDTNDLHVIRPSSAEPVYTKRNIFDTNVMSMICIPHSDSHHISKDDCSSIPWMAHSRLFFTDKKSAIFTLTGSEVEQVQAVIRKPELRSFVTPMGHILDKVSNDNNDYSPSSSVSQILHGDINGSLKVITDSPAHILPSVADHCASFLASFLSTLKIDHALISSSNDTRTQTQLAVSLDSALPCTADYPKLLLESANSAEPRAGRMKFLEEL